jgi:hypothetical protein
MAPSKLHLSQVSAAKALEEHRKFAEKMEPLAKVLSSLGNNTKEVNLAQVVPLYLEAKKAHDVALPLLQQALPLVKSNSITAEASKKLQSAAQAIATDSETLARLEGVLGSLCQPKVVKQSAWSMLGSAIGTWSHAASSNFYMIHWYHEYFLRQAGSGQGPSAETAAVGSASAAAFSTTNSKSP